MSFLFELDIGVCYMMDFCICIYISTHMFASVLPCLPACLSMAWIAVILSHLHLSS